MSDHSNYRKGQIISVRMINFMTFADVTFNASPKMNIILGQNGSGKSTISCAVCLALGEDPKLLLRGNKVEEFIKYGEKQARVQLLVRGDTKDILIGVIINKSSATQYTLNNKASKKENIKELRKLLGIDLSNLCQFLPQDRVADFVNQTPQMRLREFEKSVGGQDFYENHQALISFQQDYNARHTEIEQKTQELETQRQINATLRREKDKFEAKRALQKKKEFLNYHIKMLQYDQNMRRAKSLHKEAKVLKAQIKEEDAKYAPLRQNITDYQNSINHLKSIIGAEERKIMSMNSKIKELGGKNHELYILYNNNYKAYQSIDRKRMDLVNELKKLQKEKQDIEIQLEEMGDPETIRQEISKLNEEIANINEEKSAKLQEFPDYYAKRRELKVKLETARKNKERLTNKDNAKMDHLKKTDEDTFRALQWLNQHRNMFKMTVYGPIMNEVSFKEDLACKWFENTIPNDVMLSFVTQCTEDYDLFLKEVRSKNNIRVSVINVTEDIHLTPNLTPERMAELKLHQFLGDLINSPDAVRRALFNNTSMKNIFIAKDSWVLPKNHDDMINFLDIDYGLIVLNSTQQMRIRSSRYVNTVTKRKEISLQVSQLRECRIMQNDDVVDREQLEYHEKTIKEAEAEMALIQQEMKKQKEITDAFDKKVRKKEEERLGFENKKRQIARLKNRLRSVSSDIQRKEDDLSKDFELEKQQQKESIQDILNQQTVLIRERKGLLAELLQLSICKEAIVRVVNAQQQHLDSYQQKLEEYTRLRKELEEKKSKMDRERDGLKTAISELKTYLYTQTGLFACDIHSSYDQCGPDCTQKTTALFEEVRAMDFSTDIESCIVELRVINTKIEEINFKEDVIRDYEHREIVIQELEKSIAQMTEDMKTMVSTMEIKEKNFKESLVRMTDKLNVNFKLFMANIKCKGEVILENVDKFQKIGLDVRVSFREDQELQSLNGRVQSGGEKSLSTVLYLLALQEMVSFPFRFIDEINQNMDKRNERYVMQQLLAKGKQKTHAPQTFVITPKLLADFPYDEQVTFHIIFQGQYLPPNFSWKSLSLYYDQSKKRERAIEDEDPRQYTCLLTNTTTILRRRMRGPIQLLWIAES